MKYSAWFINSLGGINSRLDIIEKITKLEYIAKEMAQSRKGPREKV